MLKVIFITTLTVLTGIYYRDTTGITTTLNRNDTKIMIADKMKKKPNEME